MTKIIISLANNKLKNYLRKSKEDFRYIYAGEKDKDIAELLDKKGFNEIEKEVYSKPFKDRFCREYIDLVGKIGEKHNSIYWWITFTASKNRFSSRLSYKLSSLYSIINKLKKNINHNVLIINPDESVCAALIKHLNSQDLNAEIICLKHKANRPINKMVSITRLLAWILPAFIYHTYKKIWISNRYLRKQLKEIVGKGKSYYVIKTFIFDASFDSDGHYRDSFFGALPEYIKKEKDVLMLANILGDYQKAVNSIKNCNDFLILPHEYLISYIDPMKAIWNLLIHKLTVKERSEFFGLDVTDIVNSEISRDYENGSGFENYLHFIYLKKLLRQIKIDTFTLTYENNPWEKMCMIAIRKYSSATTVIGYQHAVIPQSSANMFISQYEKDIIPMPDRILTVGEVPKEIMEKYGAYKRGIIEPSCGLRFEYLSRMSTSKRKKTGNILVVLEGVFEVYKMVNFVLKELSNKTKYQVTIRTHPVLPLDKFQHKLEYNLLSTPNFEVSNKTALEDDIDFSDIVIYWGSTVALEALSMGKPVIHFETGSILSYDPLFECGYLKWTVTERDSLSVKIEEVYALSDDDFDFQLEKAKEYLGQYFYPVTEENLKKFVV